MSDTDEPLFDSRHALATAVTGWTCVKCRTHFDVWPNDTDWCPFPPDEDDE